MGDGEGSRVEWVLEPLVVFKEQILALMMSSHHRCGRNSPASVLTSHNVPLLMAMVDGWSRGRVVISSDEANSSVIVGVSLDTLGVTSTTTTSTKGFTQHDIGDVVWIDTTHYIECHGIVGQVKSRVTVTDVETEPRKLRCAEEGEWNFQGFVDGLHFCVTDEVVCDGVLITFICHLIDAESAFESGVMVPVDTVKVTVPPELVIHYTGSYLFWDCKRLMLETSEAMYELLLDGTTRVLFKMPTKNHTVMHHFVVAQRQVTGNKLEAWNFLTCPSEPIVIELPRLDTVNALRDAGDFLVVENENKVYLVDPSSGVIIFTLTVNCHFSLYCVNNDTFLI
ncbi:hypothetical protein Pelo_14804 [Pelomyxa schiedti]|nr:hypothetical protein Pelo_14804 [Pelomyxa schiedti]